MKKKTDEINIKTKLRGKIFNEKLVAVHKIKETLTLNRSAYVGMCILVSGQKTPNIYPRQKPPRQNPPKTKTLRPKTPQNKFRK